MTCRCPFCGEEMSPWLRIPRDWRRAHLRQEYQLYWCARDAYGMLWPRPSAEDVLAAYAVDYYTHGAAGEASEKRSFIDRLRVRIAWQFDDGRVLDAPSLDQQFGWRTLRICDIGCGDARLLWRLSQLGHHVAGVEPDAQARAAAPPAVSVLEGTAEDLPATLQRESFDLVIMSHVLEHCREPVPALRNAAALLAPQGMLLCEVPNNEARGLHLAGPAWHWLDVPRHLNFFTGKSLALACREAGLNVLDTLHVGYTRQFDGPWLRAEQEIAHRLRGAEGMHVGQVAALRLLATTLFAPARFKYDSVRVQATR